MILSNRPVEEMTPEEILYEVGKVYAEIQFMDEPENFFQDGERTFEEGAVVTNALHDRLAELENELNKR